MLNSFFKKIGILTLIFALFYPFISRAFFPIINSDPDDLKNPLIYWAKIKYVSDKSITLEVKINPRNLYTQIWVEYSKKR